MPGILQKSHKLAKNHSYTVTFPSGATYWHNRWKLKPLDYTTIQRSLFFQNHPLQDPQQCNLQHPLPTKVWLMKWVWSNLTPGDRPAWRIIDDTENATTPETPTEDAVLPVWNALIEVDVLAPAAVGLAHSRIHIALRSTPSFSR